MWLCSPIASTWMPASSTPSIRHSYAVDMSKSLSSSVADGLVCRAASNASRMVGMRPRSQASRVRPLGSLSNTGMITTSLITSQVSMTPAKSATSRRMRASCTSAISSVVRSSNQGAQTVCQASG
jgi:hypothetical protein